MIIEVRKMNSMGGSKRRANVLMLKEGVVGMKRKNSDLKSLFRYHVPRVLTSSMS